MLDWQRRHTSGWVCRGTKSKLQPRIGKLHLNTAKNPQNSPRQGGMIVRGGKVPAKPPRAEFGQRTAPTQPALRRPKPAMPA